MITRLKTFLVVTIAAAMLGAAIAATATPAQASNGFPRYYDYGPASVTRLGLSSATPIAAGSYPYYGDFYVDPYGYPPYGGPYHYPYPGYGYYYGY